MAEYNEFLVNESMILGEIHEEEKRKYMLKIFKAFHKAKYRNPSEQLELLEFKKEHEELLSEKNLSDDHSKYLFFKEKVAESQSRITELNTKITENFLEEFRKSIVEHGHRRERRHRPFENELHPQDKKVQVRY